jgi:hypothetical protein
MQTVSLTDAEIKMLLHALVIGIEDTSLTSNVREQEEMAERLLGKLRAALKLKARKGPSLGGCRGRR